MKKHLLLIFVCLSTLGLLIVTHYSELPAAHAQALVARESHVSGSSSQVSMKATSSGNLQYWGGTVLLHPHVYVTYWNWTSDPASEASYLESFFRGVGGSTWLNTVTQYNDTRGIFISNPANQFSGSWSDPTPIPSHPTRAQMAQEAVNTAAHFGNPVDAVYFIATPQGHSSVDTQSNGELCSLHYFGTVNPGSFIPVVDFPYPTDRSDCGNPASLDKVSIIAGHEYAEAITDPLYQGIAWSATGQQNAEIGDLCAWSTQVVQLGTGAFAVQALWDNSTSGCVFSYGRTGLAVSNFNHCRYNPRFDNFICTVTLTATAWSQASVNWTETDTAGTTVTPSSGSLAPGQSTNLRIGPLPSNYTIDFTFSAPGGAFAMLTWNG
jgi:hypothetical protein